MKLNVNYTYSSAYGEDPHGQALPGNTVVFVDGAVSLNGIRAVITKGLDQDSPGWRHYVDPLIDTDIEVIENATD